MAKRYKDLSREERIADSDRVAVMRLETELRKVIKKAVAREIGKRVPDIEKAVDKELRKFDIGAVLQEWLQEWIRKRERK